MSELSLLPPRASTTFLREFEQATNYGPRIAAGIDLIRDIKRRRLPGFLPFLLYEFGLIELTPYVLNPYILLDEGRAWQIERDTFAAVYRALGWVASPALIEEAPKHRKWWNSFQLRLENLPVSDLVDLERIEKVTGLSKPFRSDFRRGVHVYDAPALETDAGKLDGMLLEHESGVRVRAGGPLWSLGRIHEIVHELTEAEGTALGIWVPKAVEDEYLVDLLALTATIAGNPAPLSSAISFSRSTAKMHSTLAGVWSSFPANQIATTDRGALIEDQAERLSLFAPQFNYMDDADAATVDMIGIADPFGGNDAIRVTFNGSGGRTLLVPATGLQPNTQYSVSFFAKLISASGVVSGGADGGFQDVFSQLSAGQWKRIEGAPFTTGAIAGQWMDLTLDTPGASLTVELFGFQIEAGGRVTSPIAGSAVPATRAADNLTLTIPAGLADIVVRFADGTAQSFLGIIGPFHLQPDGIDKPLLTEIGTLKASTWQSMSFPWSDATFPWGSDAVSSRAIELADWFDGREAYAVLKDGGGAVIGYRRARAVRQVNPQTGGPFSILGGAYAPDPNGRDVVIDFMTEAGNGIGHEAKSVEIIFGASRGAGIPPGRLWINPGGVIGGVPIAQKSIDVPLRATVRERFKFLLRF